MSSPAGSRSQLITTKEVHGSTSGKLQGTSLWHLPPLPSAPSCCQHSNLNFCDGHLGPPAPSTVAGVTILRSSWPDPSCQKPSVAPFLGQVNPSPCSPGFPGCRSQSAAAEGGWSTILQREVPSRAAGGRGTGGRPGRTGGSCVWPSRLVASGGIHRTLVPEAVLSGREVGALTSGLLPASKANGHQLSGSALPESRFTEIELFLGIG